jgi:hypothetical protein
MVHNINTPPCAEMSSAKVKGFWARQRHPFSQNHTHQKNQIFFVTTFSHNQRALNQLTHKT